MLQLPGMSCHVCLCCRWNALDIHNDEWLNQPLSYQHFMFMNSQDYPIRCSNRGSVLQVLNHVISKGVCPGVVAWCDLCETVTALVDAGISDPIDAIIDVLQRYQMLQEWVDRF